MRASLSQLGNILPIPKLFRQLEQEMETVIKVLQPGPLGIIEHKFSAEEIREANATVRRAVENWRRNAIIEQRNGVLKDYIHGFLPRPLYSKDSNLLFPVIDQAVRLFDDSHGGL